jgi:pseudaminic acid synthase
MSLISRIKDASQAPIIVAELSGNHHQNFDTAKYLVELAARNGADAVKLQTYTADSLTLPSRSPEFIVNGGLWDGNSLHELYQKAATPYEWHAPLAEIAKQNGIPLFSTPFDEAAVDFLESEINPELYKVSSFELTHIPLLERIAQTGKPVIMSTGMANETEINQAVSTLLKNGSGDLILLKCVNEYPSSPDGFNLRSMLTLSEKFDCLVGLSDHTLSHEIALAATALGARLIEKHFTDNRSAGGIDAGFSMEPTDLEQLVQQVKTVHSCLGIKGILETPIDSAQRQFRRSIYISKNIRQGERLTSENLKIIRPSLGLPPSKWSQVIGKNAARDLKAHSPLSNGDWE